MGFTLVAVWERREQLRVHCTAVWLGGCLCLLLPAGPCAPAATAAQLSKLLQLLQRLLLHAAVPGRCQCDFKALFDQSPRLTNLSVVTGCCSAAVSHW